MFVAEVFLRGLDFAFTSFIVRDVKAKSSFVSMGERVRQARRDMALTQQEFADLMGVTARAVQGWELNERPPALTNRRRLAEVTGKPLEFFNDRVVAA